MATVFAALMCHAPIVVPAVAGAESAACTGTTRAMREIAQRAVRSRPDRLVLVSPHSPRLRTGFGAWRGQHHGDLSAFGAPAVRIDLPDDTDVSDSLPQIGGEALDHGAVVPLSFLWEAGWRGPTAIIALPARGRGDVRLGEQLAALAGRTAVIASGDMSHRVHPGAPAGYHPRAKEFDAHFVAALTADDWDAAASAEPREIAAEDVVDSTIVAMAAAGRPLNAEVLHYEAPWGVGYTEAILLDPEPPLYAMARMTVRNALLGRPAPRFAGGPPASGVFVSMHLGSELKGCAGSICATKARLYEEVVSSALAALHDGRMPAPTPEELPEIQFEVSQLSPLEPAACPQDLDPSRYGIVVTTRSRRALLLPGLEQIKTAEGQLQACRRKAGISPDEPIDLRRFTVRVEASP